MGDHCFLESYTHCRLKDVKENIQSVSYKRLFDASTKRRDNVHEELTRDPQDSYKCHKTCVSSYTSKSHIEKFLKKKNVDSPKEIKKVKCRSQENTFFIQIILSNLW